jgi:hypothetical protein
MLTSRLLLRGLIACLCLLLSPAARAQTNSLEVAADEVYLDTTTARFSGRMRRGFESTDINKIAIFAPENANVTVYYWKSNTCKVQLNNATLPEVAEKRSAAPTGPVALKNEVRMQKFVAKVGPLTSSSKYCVGYEIRSTKALTDADRTRFDERLNATIVRFMNALLGSSGTAEADLFKRLAGSHAASDQAAACAQILARRAPKLPAKDFATLLSCELGWPLNELVVIDPTSDSWIPVRQAVEQYVSRDVRLREAIAAALLAAGNKVLASNRLARALDDELLPSGATFGHEIVYDPLSNVQVAELRASLLDDDLKMAFAANELTTDRERFIETVWKYPAALRDKTKRRPLEDAAEKQLSAFLDSTVQAKRISVTRAELRAAAEKLKEHLQAMTSPDDASFEYAPQVPALEELRNYPGLKTADQETPPEGKLLVGLSRVRRNVKNDFEQNLRNAKVLTDAVVKSDGYAAFREQLRAFVNSSGRTAVATQATFVERFPFWVTADVGVAVGHFFGEGDTSKAGPSLYFGLNFYLTELDKAEPCCHSFSQRFAFIAGLTLTDPSGVENVDGVIGDRMLMTGAGLRLTDYLRLSGGALYYRQDNPNPLVDDDKVKAAPYLSLSMDVDVIGTVKAWLDKGQDVVP